MSIARKELTRILLSAWLSLITLVALTPIAFAQKDRVKHGFESLSVSYPTSTAFTYRGQLKDASILVSGTYSFRFVLYADHTGGKRLAVAVENDVVVTNGSFTVRLDFGRDYFRTSESWLEVEVQPANQQDSFKALSPRQLLRPTGNALSAADGLVGVPLGISNGADTDPVVPDSTSTSSQETSPWVKAGRTVRLSTNTDNVGIGTTEPKAKLDVAGTIHASDAVTVGNSVGILSAGTLNLIEVDSNPLAIGFSNPMSTTPAPGPFSTVLVGIGTTAPTNTLDVNGRARIRVLTPAPLNDVVVANPNGVLFTRPANTIGGGPSWLLAGNTLTTGTEFLGTINNFPLRLFTANAERMRIMPGGNVGIATTTPSQRLTLGAGNVLLPNTSGGTDGNLYFGGITDSGQTGMRLFGGLVNTSTPGGFIDVRVNPANLTDGLRFRIDSNNGGSERMRITAAGNVGIGTPAPAARLSVGNNTFQVDASGNLIRVNNVQYSWPTLQGTPNTVLTNNGSGVLSWAPAAGGGVTGICSSGPNFVTKWSSTTALACSQIFDNATNVGIGTTTPNEKLEITGNFRLPFSTAAVGVIKSGGNRFIHNCCNASNSATGNFFGGMNAGNLILTGTDNVGVGVVALGSITSGNDNTAVGSRALVANTTGFANTAVGRDALRSTNAVANTAVGTSALFSTVLGGHNTAVGINALSANVGGGANTAVGSFALNSNSGSGNTALGANAGFALSNGHSNIYINNAGAAAESATTRIGDVQNRAFMAGIRGTTTGIADAIPVLIDSNGQLGTVSSSSRFKEHIEKMGAASEVLYRLRPVSFLYKPEYGGRSNLPQFGLIAEEVAKVAPELVAYDEQGKPHTVYYHFLAPMLLNEMQKKDSEIDAMRKRLDALEKLIAGLTKQ